MPMMFSVSRYPVAVLHSMMCAACFGCADVDRAGDVIVSDSAGVRSSMTPESPRIHRVVDAEPILSLGGAAATGPTLFARVSGVRLDHAGNLWVLDGASSEVRVFRPDGTHRRTIGRRGSGPGEFQGLRYLGELANDGIGVWDAPLGRFSIITAGGDSIRSVNLTAAAGVPLTAVSVYPDGSVLAKQANIVQSTSLSSGMLLGDTARLLRVAGDGTRPELITLAPGPTWLWTGHSQVPLPFTINTPFAVSGQDVLLADGRDFRVRVYRAGGKLVEVFGVESPPRPVDDDARAAYREYLEAIPSGPVRDDYAAALAHPRAPEWLPGYQALVVAVGGTVWAQRYSPNPLAADTWDVFSVARQWIGVVRMPAGFLIHDVADEKVVGVWHDPDGVEHVRVLRLREGEDARPSRPAR